MTRLGDDVTGSFLTGQRTVGTTVVSLVATATPATRGVQLKASASNTGTIYVGHTASVSSSNGLSMAAGEGVLLKVDDAQKIFLVSTAADQVVEYLVV